MNILRRWARPLMVVTALTIAATGLTGCVVAPAGAYYGEPVVAVAPPPPQVEVYGAPPVVGHIWIGGYWNWVGSRHAWVNGYWSAPRPGYRWVPHRWEQGPRGWYQRGGRWER
jgi:hypothetical protein